MVEPFSTVDVDAKNEREREKERRREVGLIKRRKFIKLRA